MENKPKFHPNPKLKLMDQAREVLRYHHYAYRTEQTYCQWILRYIHHFGGKTHPRHLGAKDVEAFLSHLATEGKVSGATQRQALNALVFLYRDVLDMPLDGEIAPARSKRLTSPPTVLTQAEVQRLLAAIEGKNALMTKLPLRQWAAADGMHPSARPGRRLRPEPHLHPRRQGRKGSNQHTASEPTRRSASANRVCEVSPPQGSRGRIRRGLHP